jgi:hypothetical protein
MVRGNTHYIDELVRLLKIVNKASRIEINLKKSCACWFDKYTHISVWLPRYNWKWAEELDLLL